MEETTKKEGTVTSPATKDLLTFIKEYRELESSAFKYGYGLIRDVWFNSINPNMSGYNHMCDKWHHNKKDFGSFYLGSLSHKNSIILLRYWGITDPYDHEYLKACQNDHVFQFLNDPPETAKMFHKMMLFFNNNGIDKHIRFPLEYLPEKNKRYGNSTNWGNFVLSLKHPHIFFDNLFMHYHG